MKEFLTVLAFTFKENARKKVFVISSIITILLVVLSIGIPAIVFRLDKIETASDVQTEDENKKSTLYIVDPKGILNNDFSEISKLYGEYDFKIENQSRIESLKEMVGKDDGKFLVVIGSSGGVPSLNYFVKKSGDGLDVNNFSRSIKSIFVGRLLKNAGVSDDVTKIALSDITVNVEELQGNTMRNYIMTFIIVTLIFLAIYFYSYGVSMSVASEKTSRVMEILLTSTKPSKIILGKSAAMGLLGLCQFASVIIAGIMTYTFVFPSDFKIDKEFVDFSSLTPYMLIMVLMYFLLGYSLYAMINAVAGATVSKAEDINSALIPISIITLVVYYAAFGALSQPEGQYARIISIIPFSSPLAMPCRLMMSEVPVGDMIASIATLIITIFLLSWLSIKIYSNAVLHYGRRLKIGDLFKFSR
ncbi:ABC transporter permease [Acetivibrio cellulolyticus]|uniref:ABC transporter permease n=1 Tax=Acetivibrio cellulolyticus TaxID=35830 RepID=UPI0001E2EBD5|nr:ABC transporter permease [Acetivibrio cellulolyticus]